MSKIKTLEALSALGHETRLDVFRLLVKTGPEGLPAGEIATRQNVVQNTIATHLAILNRAGLIKDKRVGRVIKYSANYQVMRNLLMYLMEDCCQGDSRICGPIAEILACGG